MMQKCFLLQTGVQKEYDLKSSPYDGYKMIFKSVFMISLPTPFPRLYRAFGNQCACACIPMSQSPDNAQVHESSYQEYSSFTMNELLGPLLYRAKLKFAKNFPQVSQSSSESCGWKNSDRISSRFYVDGTLNTDITD